MARTRRTLTDKEMVKKHVRRLRKEGKNPEVKEVIWHRKGITRTEYELTYDL